MRDNLSVGFQYISFWLSGRGAAQINNLMEDADDGRDRSLADR